MDTARQYTEPGVKPKQTRKRRQYANDGEIDRLIEAARRHGLTPGALTFHPDGGVTVAQAAHSVQGAAAKPEESAYDRWKNRQAAKNSTG